MSETHFPLAAMLTSTDILTIERTLQLAIAPAFVLGGIMAMLSLLTARLQRLGDLDRGLQATGAATPRERRALLRRARVMYAAISAAMVSAVLLCALVVVSFVEPLFGITVGLHVALLLITAMVSLTAALLLFFWEILLSARGLAAGLF